MFSSRDLDLLQEPYRAECSSEVRPQHLDRDPSMVLQVLGKIDDRHASFAKAAFELVAVGKRG